MTFEDILFSLSKFHLSFLETLPRGHTRYNRLIVSTNHRPQYREQIQAKPLFPDFHITEIFVPFQGSRLDPRQGTRSYASTPRVSRTLFNSCSFVPHGRSRTPDRKRNNTVSRPVKRREARAIRDSSFVEIRANFSYDRTILINWKASRVKNLEILSTNGLFKRSRGFACFQEIKHCHPGQREARPTINYIISIDPRLPVTLSKHFRSVRVLSDFVRQICRQLERAFHQRIRTYTFYITWRVEEE